MKKKKTMLRILATVLVLLVGLTGCSLSWKKTGEESSSDGKPAKTTAAPEAATPAPTTEVVPFARQLEERWMSGDLSDLAGYYLPQAADPEEAAKIKAVRDDFAAFEEETDPADPGKEQGLLSLVQGYTRLEMPEIPADAAFPLDIQVKVTTPDLAGILKDLGYENYESQEKLWNDLEKELKRGGYPERTSEVTLTLNKDGETVYAEPNREALFAFYGGLAELYMEEYRKYLEEIGNVLGGQEP